MPVGCNARLRALLTAYAGQPLPAASEPLSPRPTPRVSNPDEPASRSPASYLWAALLARISAIAPAFCLAERQVAQFIQDNKIDMAKSVCQASLPGVELFQLAGIDQFDR